MSEHEELDVIFHAAPVLNPNWWQNLLHPQWRYRAVLTADGVNTGVIAHARTLEQCRERARMLEQNAAITLQAMGRMEDVYHLVRRQRQVVTAGVAVGDMIELAVAIGKFYPVGQVCQVVDVDIYTTVTHATGERLMFPVMVSPLNDSGEPEGIKIPLNLEEYNVLEVAL